MRDADTWALAHAERAALAADLADLDDARWATPSLCAGLTVREVLAHVTAAASLNALQWLAGVVRRVTTAALISSSSLGVGFVAYDWSRRTGRS
jgi:uncharacterized protein (TIGR03083 family)